MSEQKYERKSEFDRRISRGDDFAGDAWLNKLTGDIEWGAVGRDRNLMEDEEAEREFAQYEKDMIGAP